MYRRASAAYVVPMLPRSGLDPDDLKARFGANLMSRRRAAGLTQDELSARSRVHVTYISEAERGRRNVSVVNIAKLAAGLGISAGELLEGLPPEDRGGP